MGKGRRGAGADRSPWTRPSCCGSPSPSRAIAGARADALLAASTDPWTLSVARHARGLLLREQGRLAEAVSELRWAVRLARRSGTRTVSPTSARRSGAALVMDGRSRAGSGRAGPCCRGRRRPAGARPALMRRGVMLIDVPGAAREALPDLRAALTRRPDPGRPALGGANAEQPVVALPRRRRRRHRPAGAGGRTPVLRVRGPGGRGRAGAAQPGVAGLRYAVTCPRPSGCTTGRPRVRALGRPARRARARPVPGAAGGRAARRGVRGGRRPAGPRLGGAGAAGPTWSCSWRWPSSPAVMLRLR